MKSTKQFEDQIENAVIAYLRGDLEKSALTAKEILNDHPDCKEALAIGRASVVDSQNLENEIKNSRNNTYSKMSIAFLHLYISLLEYRIPEKTENGFVNIVSHFLSVDVYGKLKKTLRFSGIQLSTLIRTEKARLLAENSTHTCFNLNIEDPTPIPSAETNQTIREKLAVQESLALNVIDELCWRVFEISVQKIYAQNNTTEDRHPKTKDFYEQGYITGEIPEHTRSECMKLFETRSIENTGDIGYVTFQKSDTEDILSIWENFRPTIEAITGSFQKIYRVEAKQSAPNTSDSSFRWHKDSHPGPARKLILYLDPPFSHGGTEIITRKGSIERTEQKEPTWVLFENGPMYHRGIPPLNELRHTIEITLLPSFSPDIEKDWRTQTDIPPAPRFFSSFEESRDDVPAFSDARGAAEAIGTNYGKMRSEFVYSARIHNTYMANTLSTPTNLNIGGGRAFIAKDWINLDGEVSREHQNRFFFHPTATFPVDDASMKRVYSSHCIEHLDTPTFNRVMTEAFRVLETDGALVLKFPNFEHMLELWADGEEPKFDQMFGITPAHLSTWSQHQVETTFENKILSWFYSVHVPHGNFNTQAFTGSIAYGTPQYHGPVFVPQADAKEILATRSPKLITLQLREYADRMNIGKGMVVHQQAWSSKEIVADLRQHGFTDFLSDPSAVIERNKDIRYIQRAPEQQTYCMCYKRG